MQTPLGKPLMGIRADSYLIAPLGEVGVDQLASEVDKHVTRFEWSFEFFDSFSKNGGAAEIFVAFFGEGAFGETFNSNVLRKLASLNLNLSLEIYGVK
jgi:hypothetical protein